MLGYGLNNKIKFDKGQAILLFNLSAVLIGLIIGFIMANSIDDYSYEELYTYSQIYFSNFLDQFVSPKQLFLQSFFKYSVFIFSIWILGFVSIGGLFIFIMVVFKGLSYGYTTCFLVNCYGYSGFVTALILYSIQFFILMSIVLYISYNSVNYIFSESNSKNYNKNKFAKYLSCLSISLVICMFLAVIETFLIPFIIKKFM